LKQRRFVFIGDVERDDAYAPYRAAASEAGYRSVLSLPVITGDGDVVGMMSVHHPAPQKVAPSDIAYLGEFAAALITRQSLVD